MNHDDSSVPLSQSEEAQPSQLPSVEDQGKKSKNVKTDDKSSKKNKKRKVNLWPLKAMIISILLSFVVNAASTIVLSDTHFYIACTITLAIIVIGVFFDMIGTAATACDAQPFMSMAAKKVKGAKVAVKLTKNRDTVSSICCDIVGDICGVVSGVCAASIVSNQIGNSNFWLSILVYALISTITITAKAVAKNIAVSQSNKIVMATAKFISIFVKEG